MKDQECYRFETQAVRGGQRRTPEGEHNDPIHLRNNALDEGSLFLGEAGRPLAGARTDSPADESSLDAEQLRTGGGTCPRKWRATGGHQYRM